METAKLKRKWKQYFGASVVLTILIAVMLIFFHTYDFPNFIPIILYLFAVSLYILTTIAWLIHFLSLVWTVKLIQSEHFRRKSFSVWYAATMLFNISYMVVYVIYIKP